MTRGIVLSRRRPVSRESSRFREIFGADATPCCLKMVELVSLPTPECGVEHQQWQVERDESGD